MSVGKRLRTLFRLFLLITVLAVVAMMSAITVIRITIRGHQETMPSLVGHPLETAQRVTSGLGLGLKIEDKLFNAQYSVNQIISQMPPPGTRVKMGQRVHVLVSLGPPQVVVPNLVGSSVRAAQITVIQRGLSVGAVAAVHWPGAEMNQVVAQDPPASSADVHSPTVNFLVALGEPPPTFLCPSFVGRPLDEVRGTLKKAGFKIGEIVTIPTDGTSKATILTQAPAAGSKIDPATVFTFQVAK